MIQWPDERGSDQAGVTIRHGYLGLARFELGPLDPQIGGLVVSCASEPRFKD
jgi:hypothetical protein